jgi:ectoine hydroxylase-related dioxygenase (phytanoyl-CoA dioxygenase family)
MLQSTRARGGAPSLSLSAPPWDAIPLPLTAEQRASFERDGYLVIRNFVPAAALTRLRASLEQVAAQLEERALPRGMAIAWESDVDDEKRVAHQIYNVHQISGPVLDVVNSKRLRALGRELVGDEIGLWHTKFLLKESRRGSEVPWHQDLAYWMQAGTPGFVTCMLYLNDADAGNGCLEVAPGSHLNGLLPFVTSRETKFAYRVSQEPAGRVVRIEAPAGTAIFFGPLLLHRSAANASERQRRSISIAMTSKWNQCKSYPDEVLPRIEDFDLSRLAIPRIGGVGSHRGSWAPYYHRRALRQLAADAVRDPSLPWFELTDSLVEEDSLAWFGSRKPEQTPYYRLQRYPIAHGRPSRVEIQTGPIEQSAAALDSGRVSAHAGLIALDLATRSGLEAALQVAARWVGVGTVLFIDRFFAPPRRFGSRSASIARFAAATGLRLSYLARTDFSVVLRVEEVGVRGSIGASAFDWAPRAAGISFQKETLSDYATARVKASGVAARARRLLGPQWRAVKQTLARVQGRKADA